MDFSPRLVDPKDRSLIQLLVRVVRRIRVALGRIDEDAVLVSHPDRLWTSARAAERRRRGGACAASDPKMRSREVIQGAGGLGEAAGQIAASAYQGSLRPPQSPPARRRAGHQGVTEDDDAAPAVACPRTRSACPSSRAAYSITVRSNRSPQWVPHGEVKPFAAVGASALAGEGALLDSEHPQRIEGAIIVRQQELGRRLVPHVPSF